MAAELTQPALGKHIRELRLRADMSVEDLARAASLSAAYISRLENSRILSPGHAALWRIARAFGVEGVEAMLAADTPVRRRSELNIPAVVQPPTERTGKERPVYRWAALGDPADADSAPLPDREEYVPLGKEGLLGPRGFGVAVRGDSMVGYGVDGIRDGDLVWVNPDRQPRHGDAVLALVRGSANGETGMVVKAVHRMPSGDWYLYSYPADGAPPEAYDCAEFDLRGTVVLTERVGPPR